MYNYTDSTAGGCTTTLIVQLEDVPLRTFKWHLSKSLISDWFVCIPCFARGHEVYQVLLFLMHLIHMQGRNKIKKHPYSHLLIFVLPSKIAFLTHLVGRKGEKLQPVLAVSVLFLAHKISPDWFVWLMLCETIPSSACPNQGFLSELLGQKERKSKTEIGGPLVAALRYEGWFHWRLGEVFPV